MRSLAETFWQPNFHYKTESRKKYSNNKYMSEWFRLHNQTDAYGGHIPYLT